MLFLARHGQLFPVDIQDPDLRLVDVISAGDGGYLEQGFGYLRSLILGVDVAYENGKTARFGGRVVKNVTGFDLTKLVVGGRGVFGLPYFAFLRLAAKPEAVLNLILDGRSAADLLFVASKLAASGLPLTALELVESQAANQAYSYALIVQIAGVHGLVAEVFKQVRLLVGNQPITELAADQLGQAYPALVRPQTLGLEISLSKASAAALIDHLAGFGERGLLRYRQGLGRLFIDCPDQSILDKVDKLVRDFLFDTKVKTGGNALAEFDQATIARVAAPFYFSSTCERSGEGELGRIISDLRRTFDPLGCFGCGVTFHGR